MRSIATSPVVSYNRKQINPASDIKIAIAWITNRNDEMFKRPKRERASDIVLIAVPKISDRNPVMPSSSNAIGGEKIRTATVPGQTLKRGQRPKPSLRVNQRAKLIYRNKMVAYFSSFLRNGWRA